MGVLAKLGLLRINAFTDSSLERFIEDIQARRTASRLAGVRARVAKLRPKLGRKTATKKARKRRVKKKAKETK